MIQMRHWIISGRVAVIIGLLLAASHGGDVHAATDAHSRKWNAFVDAVYAFHQQRLETHDIRTTTAVGGYPRHPDFYDDVSYYDAKTGRLLSKVLWQRDNGGTLDWAKSHLGIQPPRDRDHLHSIEVYIYDDKGRVIREYSATYLPNYRGAPTQTLVFLHRYNGDLHAFRSFDASGIPQYEKCTGTWMGKAVDIELDEDEIFELRTGGGTETSRSPAYRACFAGLPEQAGDYLTPR
jgi:hypothetical protein